MALCRCKTKPIKSKKLIFSDFYLKMSLKNLNILIFSTSKGKV